MQAHGSPKLKVSVQKHAIFLNFENSPKKQENPQNLSLLFRCKKPIIGL